MRTYIALHSKLKLCRRSFTTDTTIIREKRGYWSDLKNQRAFLDNLALKLNITNPNDWYKVTKQNILDNGGRSLLSVYGNSPSKAILSIYPEYDLKLYNFETVPTKFWTDLKNQRNFLEQIQIKLNLKSPQEFIHLNKSDFMQHGASGVLSHYGGSPSKMLSTVFPEISWNFWEGGVVPDGYWENIGNQQKLLESMREKFGIKNYEDWYKVSKSDYVSNGARGLLEQYQNSLFKLYSILLPQYPWKQWLLDTVSPQFWQDKSNQKDYLNWLKEELKIKKNADWYKVNKNDIVSHGGRILIELYEGSVYTLLKENFPETEWLPWRFDNQRGVWQDQSSHRKFMEWLGKELKIKSMEDWYNVSQADIKNNGGGGLLHYYEGSPSKLLTSVFPEYDWQLWKFARVPQNFWSDDKNIVEYSQFLKEKLQVENPEDWAKISNKHVSEIGGKLSVAELKPVLQKHFGYEIKSDKAKKSQRFLRVTLSQIFPDVEIVEDYRPEYMEGLELDLFIPMHNIAFEYQGEVHYKRVFADPAAIQQRDQKKREICKREGITLIPIGYWWDSRLESLQATIYKYRPDLFSDQPRGEPIRETPYSLHTVKQQRATYDKENEISKNFLLANIWNGKNSPKGWWMSEKFDGIRALWDGKRLYSRFGKEIRAPAWFVENLPRVLLDGELWMGLGHYEESIHLARSVREEKWKRASFCVFDCLDMKSQPFEDRYQFLQTLQLPNHVSVVKQIQCESEEHLDKFLGQVRDKGGEGIMIRQPGSLYESGRSNSLLKVKPYLDTEVKYLERTNGQVALVCQQTDGEMVNVACSLDVYEKPPEVGSVITVTYQGTYLSGKLKYPFYYRLRKDVSWEEIVQSKQQ